MTQPTQPAHITDPAALRAQTQTFADEAYRVVGAAYLEFRRTFYHDPNPSLATQPQASDEVQRTESARIAHTTLGALPGEVRSLPLVNDLVRHLQKMIDIQSLTEIERTQLHNMTMAFLYGVKGGVQAWYVEWLLDAEKKLQFVAHEDYYVHFPWQGLLYRPPEELARFDAAVHANEYVAIQREVGRYGDKLVEVLNNPVGSQYDLAFSGPGGERKKIVFNLKTSAGLALGAYLAVEAVRALTGATRHHDDAPPASLINELPPQMQQMMIEPAANPSPQPGA